MTPLQKAARELIDRQTPGWVNTEPTSRSIEMLRKALEAEQAQTVEPFAYFNIGIEYHTQGKISFHKEPTKNLEERWWGPDTPLYLHQAPPQAQAAGPAGEIVLFGEDLKEVSWAKGKMPSVGSKLYAHPAGEQEQVLAPMTVEDIFRASKEFKSIYSLVPHQEVIAYTRAIEARCGVK